jgi:hypothetical protein
MPHLFKSSSNTMAKLSLMLGAALPLGIFWGGSTITRSAANTKAHTPINQPIPFSHRHHAYELGIDCRFCHTSVEKSAKAGVPGADTCMTCHSQIWTNSPLLEPVRKAYENGTPILWNKVNKVPEFVYFDHSIHLARGINCNTCHGPVQDMNLTWKGHDLSMAWCLDCHRTPEKFLRDQAPGKALSPQEQVFELYRKQQAGEHLTKNEFHLLKGDGVLKTAEDVEAGRELVAKYKVNKKQLMDCWICHR